MACSLSGVQGRHRASTRHRGSHGSSGGARGQLAGVSVGIKIKMTVSPGSQISAFQQLNTAVLEGGRLGVCPPLTTTTITTANTHYTPPPRTGPTGEQPRVPTRNEHTLTRPFPIPGHTQNTSMWQHNVLLLTYCKHD